MRKESLARLGLVAMLTASVAVFGGCLDFLNDDSNAGDLPPEVIAALEAAEDDLGEGISSLALETTVGALEGMSQWGEGNFGGQARESVLWHEDDQVWEISDEEVFEDGDASGNAAWTYWVQFSAGEVFQQYPDETTDRMDVRFEGFQQGNYHPGDFDVDFHVEASTHTTATANTDGSTDIVGEGEVHGSSELHLGERTFHHQHQQNWEADFNQAANQDCVSGTVAGTLGVESDRGSRRFRFEGLFDGQGNVDWTVWHGDRVIVEETKQYDCQIVTGR